MYRIESEDKGVTLYSRHLVEPRVVTDFAQLQEMLDMLQVTEVVSWDAFGDYTPRNVLQTNERNLIEVLFVQR